VDIINKKDPITKQPEPGLEIAVNKISDGIKQREIASTAKNPNIT